MQFETVRDDWIKDLREASSGEGPVIILGEKLSRQDYVNLLSIGARQYGITC